MTTTKATSTSVTTTITYAPFPTLITLRWGFSTGMMNITTTVVAGSTITWVLDLDNSAHTVTSDLVLNGIPYVNSNNLVYLDSYSFTFSNAGTFPYYCAYHPNMIGVVVVVGPSMTTATFAPTTTSTSTALSPSLVTLRWGFSTGSMNVTTTVGTGSTITWVLNLDADAPHTVTSKTFEFDSGNINALGNFSFTFNTSGVYPYFCSYHSSMKGTVVVLGTSITPPSLPSTSSTTVLPTTTKSAAMCLIFVL